MTPMLWVAVTVGTCLLLIAVARLAARPSNNKFVCDKTEGATTLVVMVHGLTGRKAFQPAVDLAKEALAPADFLTIDYHSRLLSNANAYEIANELETRIHESFDAQRHSSIVLVGHSMGAMLLRKTLLWANGLEEDRIGAKGRRAWAGHVQRFVSLAGINRGWSIQPRPANMGLGRYIGIWLGERIARVSGTGGLLLSMQRGAPFVADSRVQWVRLARPDAQESSHARLPQVIHLLGDRDDIVSREDAQDLAVAKDTLFVTLPATDHRNIAEALHGEAGEDAERRRAVVRHALRGEIADLSPDKTQELDEDPTVRHMIYLMHGIRDYGKWTDRLREAIEDRPTHDSEAIKVVNEKYGYFPMGPFLLYWDRQKYVRQFMDEYTENIAQYPNVKRFDFVGHSNGTYILASALQHYETLKVNRVFFAGSVVPKHYPWKKLMAEGRVEKVKNVVASGDWVVALFPKFFEQIADWWGIRPTTGLLDLGAAGFRGFLDADDAQGRVQNLQFAAGQHGTGVDVADNRKLQAIVDYSVEGDERNLVVFEETKAQWGWLDVLSNVSWLAWVAIAALVVLSVLAAFAIGPIVGLVFAVVLLALLSSI
jgi:pimeloyl-ACP methyl ester carboxylesterase